MNLVTGDCIAMSFFNSTTGKLEEWKGVVLEPPVDGKCHVARDDGAEICWEATESNTRILRRTVRRWQLSG